MGKIMATAKAVTDGVTQGRATRIGDTMGESSVQTSVHRDTPGRDGKPGFDAVTLAKTRIHEDGSGLFELRRGPDTISIRWSGEETPLELFASFNGEEGIVVPAQETPEVTP